MDQAMQYITTLHKFDSKGGEEEEEDLIRGGLLDPISLCLFLCSFLILKYIGLYA
jgi:hypothetical protein